MKLNELELKWQNIFYFYAHYRFCRFIEQWVDAEQEKCLYCREENPSCLVEST